MRTIRRDWETGGPMRKYILNAAQARDHSPEYPERTAFRNCAGHINFDVQFQVWPNRPALLTTLSIQGASGVRNPWRPVVKRPADMTREEYMAAYGKPGPACGPRAV